MADRGHANRDQVFSRQVRQDVSVDCVVAERRLVLRKTELLKPTRDIDRHLRSDSSGKPSIRRSHHDRNRAVHLVRDDEAKPALVEALKLNANLNLLARKHPSDAVLAADLRRSAYKAWAPQARQIGKARNPPN